MIYVMFVGHATDAALDGRPGFNPSCLSTIGREHLLAALLHLIGQADAPQRGRERLVPHLPLGD
jgi:hypothetical protein